MLLPPPLHTMEIAQLSQGVGGRGWGGGGGGLLLAASVKVRDAARHPPIPRTALHRQELSGPNVSGAEVEKPS